MAEKSLIENLKIIDKFGVKEEKTLVIIENYIQKSK